ncbi:MAG TPA: protease modulator HflC [Polyangiaceae bacterium]|nr:protease modulator HflC [Polyangiaceae bacterium]
MSRSFIVILLAVLVYVGWSSFFVLEEGEQAIVVRLGDPKKTYKAPGLRFKAPFFDSVTVMEKRVLSSDTPQDEYITLDKKKLVADPISRWRIVEPLLFYQNVTDELGAKERLDDIVKSELREAIAKRDFGSIIGSKREDLVQEVISRARPQLRLLGIGLVDVRIKRADLPREVQESVFQRMRAERDRIAKRYRSEGLAEAQKIQAEADKQRSILLAEAYEKAQKLRGEGDAESIAIYAQAYEKDAAFYDFTRSLEAYEKLVDENTQLVLSTDNALLKHISE